MHRGSWIVLLLLVAGALAPGCSRRVEIFDDRDPALEAPAAPSFPEAGVPTVVDEELLAGAFPCAERQVGPCVGPTDFPCAAERWLSRLVEECQSRTGCRARGWLEVELGAEGCAERIGMAETDADFAGCLAAELAEHYCPCSARALTNYLVPDQPECRAVDGGGRTLH